MMSGISSDMTMILWLSALVSAVNFFASFLGGSPHHSHSVLETLIFLTGMALIDRLGRRVLCLGSYIGILASLLVIGAGFQLSEYIKVYQCDLSRYETISQERQVCVTTFRNNTTSAATTAVEPQLPSTDPIYDQCASFTDCNACTYEYDDFVSISVNIFSIL